MSSRTVAGDLEDGYASRLLVAEICDWSEFLEFPNCPIFNPTIERLSFVCIAKKGESGCLVEVPLISAWILRTY